MTGWFHRSVSFAAMVRDSVSAAPADSGTTTRMARSGYRSGCGCGAAAPAHASAAARKIAAARATLGCFSMVSSSCCGLPVFQTVRVPSHELRLVLLRPALLAIEPQLLDHRHIAHRV